MWGSLLLWGSSPEEFKELIDLDPSEIAGGEKHKKYNDAAVLRHLRRNPGLARQRYQLRGHPGRATWPLASVVALGASLDVVQLMAEACPEALDERVGLGRFTPLHYACMTPGISTKVLQCMLEKGPSALSKTDSTGGTPLHTACKFNAGADIAALFLQASPQIARTLDDKNRTPLHCACMYGASLDTVKVLIGTFPEALFQRDSCGNTPLDIANNHGNLAPQVDLISKLMELLSSNSNYTTLKHILLSFRSMSWWGGISIALQKNRGKSPLLNLDCTILAELLPQLAHHCGLPCIYSILSQRPDLLPS